ncbi:MAG: hypothetical protein HRT37_24275 [Alteromonadaceae bacterium]|nr:hypothetical protein [Alteromonadaceae bacterium]
MTASGDVARSHEDFRLLEINQIHFSGTHTVSPNYKGGFISQKFNFTIAAINKIVLPDSGREEYRDTKVPKLTLRVTAAVLNLFQFQKKLMVKMFVQPLGDFQLTLLNKPVKKPVKNYC